MLKTELLYFITEMRSGWVVHCEKLLYGPFPRFRDAMGRAVSEAESTVSLGSEAPCSLKTKSEHSAWNGRPITILMGLHVPGPFQAQTPLRRADFLGGLFRFPESQPQAGHAFKAVNAIHPIGRESRYVL